MPMKNPNHPGDIIRDCLDELGVNVTEGAKALGAVSPHQPQGGGFRRHGREARKGYRQHGGLLASLAA